MREERDKIERRRWEEEETSKRKRKRGREGRE